MRYPYAVPFLKNNPVKFVKFLRTPFLTEHLRWLLLIWVYLEYIVNLIKRFCCNMIPILSSGLFLKNKGMRVWYSRIRTRKSSKRAKLWIFTPHFSKFRAFTTLHPSKQNVFLEVLGLNVQKETLALVFSCEFCEISKSTFLTEHLDDCFYQMKHYKNK